MKLHLTILGWIYAVTGGAGLLVGLALTIPYQWREQALIALTGLESQLLGDYLTLILGILLVASLLSLIEGIGLLKQKNWARPLGIALGILSLFDLPIGTVIGIYTIYVLWQKEPK
ncbi:MAG: DUF2127 domain-containing protein [Candidatus Peribacteraceae bacterium]|jgi:uncharacterized membrane protein (DUF2068 family)